MRPNRFRRGSDSSYLYIKMENGGQVFLDFGQLFFIFYSILYKSTMILESSMIDHYELCINND